MIILKYYYELLNNIMIKLLISKVNSFNLKKIVNIYLQSLLYFHNFANAINLRFEDYTFLISNLKLIEIYMKTLLKVND